MEYKVNGEVVGRGNTIELEGAGITSYDLDDGIVFQIPTGGGGDATSLQGFAVLASAPNPGDALISDGTSWGGNKTPTLLFTLTGADMNTTADQPLIGPTMGTSFIISDIIFKNASTNLTGTDNVQFWSGAAQSGTQYNNIGSIELNKLTSNTKYLSSIEAGQHFNNIAGASVILSVGTPLGAPGTVDILVFGYVLA